MREPGPVLTDLGEQHRGEHGSDAGEAREDRRVRVLSSRGCDRVVILGELRVQQLQHLSEGESGEALARDRAWGAGEQVLSHPVREGLRGDSAGVVVSGEEPGHPGGLHPGRVRRRRIVRHE